MKQRERERDSIKSIKKKKFPSGNLYGAHTQRPRARVGAVCTNVFCVIFIEFDKRDRRCWRVFLVAEMTIG